MATTMKDVAERVGVSVTTVSHVLNRTRPVASETVQRVMDAVQEMNYYKNALASRLAQNKSNFFGLVVSDIGNPFFPEVIKSFEAGALNKGFDLLLFNTNYDPRRAESAVRMMIENRARGVAIMTSEFSPVLTEELAAHHVGVVFLDVGAVGNYVSNIRVNYSEGIFEAIKHLSDLGHKEFGFIAGPPDLRSAAIRRQAFTDALAQQGMSSYCIVEGNHKIDGGKTAVRTLLERPKPPTAILCSNDLTAIGATVAIHDAGLRVPEDMSVVGFDDIQLCVATYPPLTTISLSREMLGGLAFEALTRLLRSKRKRGSEYIVGTKLIVRQSTAPPPLSCQHSAGSQRGSCNGLMR
jgi:DNA-binding LacI/PurR family transcriptional regulator